MQLLNYQKSRPLSSIFWLTIISLIASNSSIKTAHGQEEISSNQTFTPTEQYLSLADLGKDEVTNTITEPTELTVLPTEEEQSQSTTTQPELGETDYQAQFIRVTDLEDISPDHWAYEAVKKLVEKYGCITGYPDNTFRGNRKITRYEFAAAMSSCLDYLTGEDFSDEELNTFIVLREEFSKEIAFLESRVDDLEARTAFVEDNQFSTTTKLFGQVIIGVQGRTDNTADFFPVDGVEDTEDPGTEVNLLSNTQLSLFTQFSPRNFLLVGLAAGTGGTTPRLTNDTRLGYEGNTNGNLILSDLTYRHLVLDNLAVVVGTEGVNPINVFRGANRVESAGFGPISAFAQRNPIIAIGGGRGGLGVDWQVSDRISLQGVYSVRLPEDPSIGGIFGSSQGENTLGLQLTYAPNNAIDIALHYLNSYSPLGRLRTGIGDDQVTVGTPINTNAIGATVSWRITPQLTIGGWGGYASSARQGASGNVETTNWMFFVNLPDLGGEGNLGGFYIGQPPRISSSDLPTGENIPNLLAGGIGTPGDQPGTTTHLELFYRYRLTDNITLTPGVIVILNPAHTPESDTIAIGALRTTFTF